MPDTVFKVLALALAGVFAWSAGAKILRWDQWRLLLARYGLPTALEVPARPLVPVTELSVAVALAAGAIRLGAAASVALLAAFSLAVLQARAAQGDKLPCGCFGKTKTRDYRLSLVRNAVLGAVAATLLLRGQDGSPFKGFAAPSGSEGIAFLLVVMGASLIAWMMWNVLRVGRDGSRRGT